MLARLTTFEVGDKIFYGQGDWSTRLGSGLWAMGGRFLKNGRALPNGIDRLECFGQLQDGEVSTRFANDLQTNG